MIILTASFLIFVEHVVVIESHCSYIFIVIYSRYYAFDFLRMFFQQIHDLNSFIHAYFCDAFAVRSKFVCKSDYTKHMQKHVSPSILDPACMREQFFVTLFYDR